MRNIIVLNLNYIGDVLFTTPALAALRRGYPDAYIAVMISARAPDVLAANPSVDEVLLRPRSAAERLRLLRGRRARGVDRSVGLPASSLELAAWGRLLGCRIRCGFERGDTRWFLNRRVRQDGTRHAAEDYLALACAGGGIEDGHLPRIYLTPEEEAWGAAFDFAGARGRTLVGVHMGASYPEKCWRPERYVDLARLAAEQGGSSGASVLVVFGGKDEEPLGTWLAGQAPNVVNLAGRLPLRQYMAAVRRCAVFVGGDSGPTHIAAALDVPTVALFGFSNPKRTGVLGERVITLGEGGTCDTAAQRRQASPYQWLDPITPAEVWKAVCHWSASSSST